LACGVLGAGVLLTHGTEVYTLVVVLTAFALAQWRCLKRWLTLRDVALAVVVVVLLALPYLPVLLRWAGGGAAINVGNSYFADRHAGLDATVLEELLFWASAVSSGLAIDLPLRLGVIGAGAWVTLRDRQHRWLVATIVIFVTLVAIFRHVTAAPVQYVFARTLPWGVDDRLVMVVSILSEVLGGAALVCVGRAIIVRARASSLWARRLRALSVFALTFAVATVGLIAFKFDVQTGGLISFSEDDQAALSWLHQNAESGDVVLNDGFADAGIWAPYKASVAIVLPRTTTASSDSSERFVREHVTELGARRDVDAAACALHIRYVYRGSAPGPEAREFPSADALRTRPGLANRFMPSVAVLENAPSLREVFASGAAAIFETNLECET
jgi:hypothetical protein